MKKYLIIMRFIGSTIILKRIDVENDSEAIKKTVFATIENLYIEEEEEKIKEEEEKQIIKQTDTELINMIQKLCFSSDLLEVILYDISDDKISFKCN